MRKCPGHRRIKLYCLLFWNQATYEERLCSLNGRSGWVTVLPSLERVTGQWESEGGRRQNAGGFRIRLSCWESLFVCLLLRFNFIVIVHNYCLLECIWKSKVAITLLSACKYLHEMISPWFSPPYINPSFFFLAWNRQTRVYLLWSC